ncbi:metallophosphoesterase [Pseudoalteromonas phenolica]|uniref:metallophosphoesterase n=1 Tax=Pseudoalteromonas phenolica TaxID=161398 RepID=UPI00110BD775|nr:metallophosphoesterase [Pseudoalteromonas phenolica]TMO53595.1 metallophosphoesterase [Pseudoalteromonas phenolica]
MIKSRFRITLCASLIFASQISAAESTSKEVISDGPYIDVHASALTVNWICNDQVKRKQVNLEGVSLPYGFTDCGLTANTSQLTFDEQLIEFQGVKRVAALSDLHGQYDLMLTLLKNNGIINAQNQWAFGDGHFVITGDIFDRGDKVTEILWFIHDLEKQAEQAGGKIHLLLGNHEVMVLNGDLRYLHPKYVKAEKLLETPFDQLFNQDTILGRWLRSKPVLVKINDHLYAHGGFHPQLAEDKVTLDTINKTFKSHLVEKELPKKREGFARYLHKTHGPIWYRGYFKDDGATAEELDLLLKHFDVNHIVVGHTSQKKIETRFKGKVIAIDSSIKRGKYGEVLFIENGKHERGTLEGKRKPLMK